MLGVLAASLHLRLIVWNREDLLDTSQLRHRSIRGVVKLSMLASAKRSTSLAEWTHLGAVMVRLQHHRAVAELLNKAVFALDG